MNSPYVDPNIFIGTVTAVTHPMRAGLMYMIVIFMMIFLSACSDTTSASGDDQALLIRTIDKDKQPLKAEIAKWWFSASPEVKNDLSCEQATCSEWILRGSFTKPVTVYAHATQVKENDEECWDFFEGEAEVQHWQKEIALTLLYTATACK